MFTNNTEELAQNKLILLYIIKTAPYKFNKNTLNDFILERNYMNYFLLQQYLGELLESNFLNMSKENDDEFFELTKEGSLVLEYFSSKVPEDLKTELNKEFKEEELIKEKEAQIFCEYFPRDDGLYIVNLKLIENEDTLFSLYLNVATKEQAESVCHIWRNKTNDIYMDIMNMFIEE